MITMMALFGSRRPRPARGGHTHVLALLAVVSLSACGGSDDHGDQDASTPDAAASARSPSPTPDSRERDAGASAGMPIQISFGDTELAARLLDNPTARDLAAQLPLTLTFRDHNHVEKTAPLPRPLSVDGAPAGHDPAAGDIGYWAPGRDFVLYYDDDAPYFEGIVRIGKFNGDTEAIKRLPDASRVTITRAG
jgi:hypothetical protein